MQQQSRSAETPRPTPLLCSRRDAASALGISLRFIDGLISKGIVQTRRLGRRRLVVVKSLEALARRDVPVISAFPNKGHVLEVLARHDA